MVETEKVIRVHVLQVPNDPVRAWIFVKRVQKGDESSFQKEFGEGINVIWNFSSPNPTKYSAIR